MGSIVEFHPISQVLTYLVWNEYEIVRITLNSLHRAREIQIRHKVGDNKEGLIRKSKNTLEDPQTGGEVYFQRNKK